MPPDKLSDLLRPRGTPLWAAAITGRLIIEKCPAPEDENTAKTSLWYSHRSHGGREYHFRSVLEFSSPKATPLATEVSLKTAQSCDTWHSLLPHNALCGTHLKEVSLKTARSSDTSPEARQFIRPRIQKGADSAFFAPFWTTLTQQKALGGRSRIQKGKRISSDAVAMLRKRKLIEGS